MYICCCLCIYYGVFLTLLESVLYLLNITIPFKVYILGVLFLILCVGIYCFSFSGVYVFGYAPPCGVGCDVYVYTGKDWCGI